MQIVLTDPARDDQVAIVGVASQRCGVDPECVVSPDEHDSLSRPSYVRFEFARLTSARLGLRGAASGVIQVSKPVSPAVLDKVVAALRVSRLTPNEVKEHLRRSLARPFSAE